MTREQMTREDAVSRESVMRILYAIKNNPCNYPEDEAIYSVEHLPPVTPKPMECEDCVSREDVKSTICELCGDKNSCPFVNGDCDDLNAIDVLPSVTPKHRLCKECEFFEYDHVENVDGIPLIVAHEICNKWGDGCKTSEDGYCFLFEPKEGESE